MSYFITSIVVLLLSLALMVIGIRGGISKDLQPLNVIDASSYVTKTTHSDVVLNTPFFIIRTINKTSFVKPNISNQSDIEKYVQPIKTYINDESTKPNVVIFIVESLSREYIGAYNQNTTIKNYKSYTPFLDSLAQHSMIYTNSYANGKTSVQGMSSVIAGIPSFKDSYSSSPYTNQPVESVVSVVKSMGYDTSFFHGAKNGSMGFLGFSNIFGIDNYYGMDEFNDFSEFDGTWGIWDEPFFQFMKKTLDVKKEPFLAINFTVTSHHPFTIPEKYKDKFPEGDLSIHKSIRYTDYSIKKFIESAKKEPWFDNTIFIITGDHCNQVFYDEYTKVMNWFAVPILIYKSDNSLKGVSTELAQQIDIYPTVIDMVGYNKPFRSWGRSLFRNEEIKPFVINYSTGLYYFQKGNYICAFDGEKIAGIFSISDINLDNNLIDDEINEEMKELELACKAFIQDYYDRIIDRKLKP